MKEARIGVVTDWHAKGDNLRRISQYFEDQEMDAVVFLGDIPKARLSDPNQEYNDIRTGLIQLAEFKRGPVYVFPGNYERYETWNAAFDDDESENVIDMSSKIQVVSLNSSGLQLAFIAGTQDFSAGFCIQDEKGTIEPYSADKIRVYNPEDLKRVVSDPEKTILFAHQPPLQYDAKGTDVSDRVVLTKELKSNGRVYPVGFEFVGSRIEQFPPDCARVVRKNVGNPYLRAVIDDIGITKVSSGDIHMAFGGFGTNGESIQEGFAAPILFHNPGAAVDGRFGVLNVKGGSMEYRNLKL